MRLIFIRGLPGTGKTLVAEILKKILDSEMVCVDKFKLQAMKREKDFERANKIAHEKTLKKLQSFYEKGKKCVIVEELISDREFYNQLRDFMNKTNSYAKWFRLMRSLEKLLEVESSRKRKIKNTKQDFDKLKRDLESIEIREEIKIRNDILGLSIKKILLSLFS